MSILPLARYYATLGTTAEDCIRAKLDKIIENTKHSTYFLSNASRRDEKKHPQLQFEAIFL
jgi:hypothetical protein